LKTLTMAPNAGRPSGKVTLPVKDAALALEAIAKIAQATTTGRAR
jgi:hypothetical protein